MRNPTSWFAAVLAVGCGAQQVPDTAYRYRAALPAYAEGEGPWVVLDEAHRLAKDITLPKVMKEGRKFGVAVVVASQGLGDFHQDVLGNAGTKVIFRVNYPESRRIAGFIRSRQGQDLAERIEQMPVGSAYVQTPEMPYGSVIRMYPPELVLVRSAIGSDLEQSGLG